MKNSYYAKLLLHIDKSAKKGARRRLGPGVIIGRFGNKYALVHFRGAYLEVGLGDMRSGNRLFGVLGRYGAFGSIYQVQISKYIIWLIPIR